MGGLPHFQRRSGVKASPVTDGVLAQTQFADLLTHLKRLQAALAKLSATEIFQEPPKLNRWMLAWQEFRAGAEATVPAAKYQGMCERVDSLVATYKSCFTQTLRAQVAQQESQGQAIQEQAVQQATEEQEETNHAEESEAGYRFFEDGKEFSDAEFEAHAGPILCLDTLCAETETPQLSIVVETEWYDPERKSYRYGSEHLRVRCSLEIEVNDESGEDGAPAPCIDEIPIHELSASQQCPSLDELSGAALEGDDWGAWLGNDAPDVHANKLQFGQWQGDSIAIHWQGSYTWRETASRLRFRGLVLCRGISIAVREEGEEEHFFLALWGATVRERMKKIDLGWQDYGEHLPEGRRRWKRFLFERKR